MGNKKGKFRKWMKGLGITIGSIVLLVIILLIIFQELSFRLLFAYGYQEIYHGEDQNGNKRIEYALSKFDTIKAEDYRHWSVQNTKNGNYNIAHDLLEKSMQMSPDEISRYYGWLLLFYYHEYEDALEVLEHYDALTPNFSDAPMGTDIHYLKGLAHMQLLHYEKAVEEFDFYINELSEKDQEDFVDVYTFVQKGRCLFQLARVEESIEQYQKAIKYYANCSEAYYYMGLANIRLGNRENACNELSIALEKTQVGLKSTDNYVEYFHEIYPEQVADTLSKYCY